MAPASSVKKPTVRRGAPCRSVTSRTGRPLVELDGLCEFDSASDRAPRRTARMPALPGNALRTVRDAAALVTRRHHARLRGGAAGRSCGTRPPARLLHAEVAPETSYGVSNDDEGNYAFDVVFTPDSTRLIVSGHGEVRSIRTDTWELERQWVVKLGAVLHRLLRVHGRTARRCSARGAQRATPVRRWSGSTPDRSPGCGGLPDPRRRGVTTRAISPDLSLVATGGADGSVRVWDAVTGVLVHEIPFGGARIGGVAFVDDRHLAVAFDDGSVRLVTIDGVELLDIVRRSLERGFTESECDRFDLGDDCPTLYELRGQPSGPDDPNAVNGTYRLEWTPDELVTATIDAYRELNVSREATEMAWSGAQGIALAGSHTLRFRDGRFDHSVVGADGVRRECTGS